MQAKVGAEDVSSPGQSISKGAGILRKYRRLILFIGTPILISIVYYGLIASDVYVTESRFVIKSPDQKRSQSSTLANLIQTTGLSSGQEQTNEILGYIRSRDAVAGLQGRMNVRAMYSRPGVDWLSRFPLPFQEPSSEHFFRYYGDMVEARLDSDTGLAVLTVKAFTAEDAQKINAGLLRLSEELVNRLNRRAQSRQVAEAEDRVREAERRVRSARVALSQYRNTARLFDPAEEATGVLEVSNALIARQAALQAQLQAMLASTPRNPSIPALRRQIAAVQTQIAGQTSRAAGTTGGLASKVSEYENLMVEQEFATEMLNISGASLEQARAEALQQQFYLERVVEPILPDTPVLPRRLTNILTVAGVSLCLYLLGWMLIVGILEHRPED